MFDAAHALRIRVGTSGRTEVSVDSSKLGLGFGGGGVNVTLEAFP